MSEENKKVANTYHELKPEAVEGILTPDFIGRHPHGSTWDRDSHIEFWSREDLADIKDVIHEQIAEGDWVATRFVRIGTYQDKPFKLDIMHFKRFEGGKIAEIWEYYDRKQFDEQTAAD